MKEEKLQNQINVIKDLLNKDLSETERFLLNESLKELEKQIILNQQRKEYSKKYYQKKILDENFKLNKQLTSAAYYLNNSDKISEYKKQYYQRKKAEREQ